MSLSNESYSLVPSIARRERSGVGRLVAALLSQWAQRNRGSPPTNEYLRRDIGLEPIEPRSHWDHQ